MTVTIPRRCAGLAIDRDICINGKSGREPADYGVLHGWNDGRVEWPVSTVDGDSIRELLSGKGEWTADDMLVQVRVGRTSVSSCRSRCVVESGSSSPTGTAMGGAER